jgi:hypothetical protein
VGEGGGGSGCSAPACLGYAHELTTSTGVCCAPFSDGACIKLHGYTCLAARRSAVLPTSFLVVDVSCCTKLNVKASCLCMLPQVHQQVITRITKGVEAYGFSCRGVTESPLKGDKGGNTGDAHVQLQHQSWSLPHRDQAPAQCGVTLASLAHRRRDSGWCMLPGGRAAAEPAPHSGNASGKDALRRTEAGGMM